MSSNDIPNLQKSPLSREEPHVRLLAENAASIRQLSKRLITDVIEIGQRLSQCKKLLGHGNWLPWIRHEFRWSERTARNFINAYEFAQSKSANISDFGIDVSSFYLLAAPSTPEKARAEVSRRAAAGEILPYAEVKLVVGEAKDSEATAGVAKRRITVREVIKGPYGEFAKLPAVEQDRILAERPANLDLAITDATTRQRWKPPFRQLQDVLDALESMTRWSTYKIIAAIPVEHITATEARLKRANDVLIKLDTKLKQVRDIRKTFNENDVTRLTELLRKARTTHVKAYGRPNQAKIIEKIWSELNPAQIGMLVSGHYGQAIKATATRLMLKRDSDGAM